MSRIGKLPVIIPEGLEIKFDSQINRLEVKGPQGILTRQFSNLISIEIKDKKITVKRKSESKKGKSFHGLTRTLINNMVKGVTEGFEKRLIIQGVGYKAQLKDKELILNLGFSHPVQYAVPPEVILTLEGKNEIKIRGHNKELIGQVAAEIRGFKKPDPYKGRGIRYFEEKIQLKPGKSATSGGGK